MSNAAINWAYDQRIGSPARKAVLVAIADHAGPDGFAWPGIKRLSIMTDQSERTVQRHIARLAEDGFIRIEPRYLSNRARDRDGYWLLAPADRLSKTKTDARPPRPGDRMSPPAGDKVSPAPRQQLSPQGDNSSAAAAAVVVPPVTTVSGHIDEPLKEPLDNLRARNPNAAAADSTSGSGPDAANGAADAQRFWDSQQGKLCEALPIKKWSQFIQPLQPSGLTSEQITLTAPTSYVAECVQGSYQQTIERVIGRKAVVVARAN